MKKRCITGLAAAVILCAVGFIVTSDKTPGVPADKKDGQEREEAEWDRIVCNPLRKKVGAKAAGVLWDYYRQKEIQLPLVESFDDIEFFSKKGMESGSYVVYVKYKMKMKDIYTKVPGLGTFYMKWNGSDGTYDLFTDSGIEGVREEMAMLNGQEDVQMLFAETRKEYTEAVQSDALLMELVSEMTGEKKMAEIIR